MLSISTPKPFWRELEMYSSIEKLELFIKASKCQSGLRLTKWTVGKLISSLEKLGIMLCMISMQKLLQCSSLVRDKNQMSLSGWELNKLERVPLQDYSTTKSHSLFGLDTKAMSTIQKKNSILSPRPTKTIQLFLVWTQPLKRVENNSKLTTWCWQNVPQSCLTRTTFHILTQFNINQTKKLISRGFGRHTRHILSRNKQRKQLKKVKSPVKICMLLASSWELKDLKCQLLLMSIQKQVLDQLSSRMKATLLLIELWLQLEPTSLASTWTLLKTQSLSSGVMLTLLLNFQKKEWRKIWRSWLPTQATEWRSKLLWKEELAIWKKNPPKNSRLEKSFDSQNQSYFLCFIHLFKTIPKPLIFYQIFQFQYS